jgi:transposase InsO family protein
VPHTKKTSADSIRALQCVFDKLGAPRPTLADRGAAFTSRMFKTFLAEQTVELHNIVTGTPRGNGQIERLMRIIFNLLRATLTADKENTWFSLLPGIEDVINITVHAITEFAPTVLHLGINPRLSATIDFLAGVPRTISDIDPNDAVPTARLRIAHNVQRLSSAFDVKRHASTPYAIGTEVAIS